MATVNVTHLILVAGINITRLYVIIEPSFKFPYTDTLCSLRERILLAEYLDIDN